MKVRERFKVVEFTNPGGSTAYRVTGCKRDGKQVRLNFPERLVAVEKRNELEREYLEAPASATRMVSTRLTDPQVAVAERVFAEMGDKCPLLAVRYWKEHYREPLVKKTVKEAFKEFIKSREDAKCRPDTVRDYNDRVGDLEKLYGDRQVAEILAHELTELIHRPGTTARTAINNKSKLGTFFKWAVKKKYAVTSPVEEFEKIRADREKPEVLQVADVRRLLKVAMKQESGAALPYVALGLFAGIRPTELSRLKWDNIDFEHKVVSITAAIAKKRGVRDVEMSENLIRFLLPHAVKKTPIVPKNWRRIWDRVRLAAGFGNEIKGKPDSTDLKPWVEDVMRHTAISHHFKQQQHEGKTASWAGNTPEVIHTYYKNLVKEKDTKEFWSLTPASLKRNKIVRLKAAV
ncbi:MAG: hypothetical protein JWM16_3302 [Verrucomicrobiales bacterium]|nr:hypothetical protein [Verrucomicrobiales bacterium]